MNIFRWKERNMRVATRQMAATVLVSLVCAGVAEGQDAVLAQTAASPGPVAGSKIVDKNLRMPKCLRPEPLEPVHKIVPSMGRLITGRLLLSTMCSLGVDLNPIPSPGERRSGVDETGPGVATSFEQLEVLVRPGSTVTLTDVAGYELTGRIETLSSSALSLAIDGTRRGFLESDVTMIRQRRGDSLANGAWWGFGILAGLAIAGTAHCGECWHDQPAFMAAFVGLQGALGAGIGVGIDALSRGERTIYRASGVAMSVRF
jgi:hypothetical protein